MGVRVPTDFSDAVTGAESIFASGGTFSTDGSLALSAGDYGVAASEYLFGADHLTVVPFEELLLGAAASF